MQNVYLLIGSPGVGKSWVSNQLKDKFHVCEHDNYKDKSEYIRVLISLSAALSKPVLGNSPFGLSEIMSDLQKNQIKVIPVFIIEPEHIISSRYKNREGKDISQGHLTRQHTYLERAKSLGAFKGTSLEALSHLRNLK